MVVVLLGADRTTGLARAEQRELLAQLDPAGLRTHLAVGEQEYLVPQVDHLARRQAILAAPDLIDGRHVPHVPLHAVIARLGQAGLDPLAPRPVFERRSPE